MHARESGRHEFSLSEVRSEGDKDSTVAVGSSLLFKYPVKIVQARQVRRYIGF